MSVRSLNKVMLIGNLTRDPELRYTPQGTAVCTFGVATNRQWTPSEGGERQEEVEFHRIVAWAKLAEICSQILHKGRKVYVEGRLQTRNWTGQDGQERTTTEIVIDTMIALGPPRPGMAEEGEEVSSEPANVAPTPRPAATAEETSKATVVPKKKRAVSKAEKPAEEEAVTPQESEENKTEDKELSEDDIPF